MRSCLWGLAAPREMMGEGYANVDILHDAGKVYT